MSTEAKVIAGIAVTTIILLFGAVMLLSKNTPVAPQQNVSDTSKLVRDDSPKIATAGAKLTIVEFGDFQCPACKAAQDPFMQSYNEHKDQITFVFRHYPLPQHKNAINGAKAAEAAGDQGKFFEMDHLLYQNQADWSEEVDPEPKLLTYAEQLKLDVNKFKQDYESNKYLDKINRDQSDGNALGVNATPTFFFNGHLYQGDFDPNSFKTTIESYLK